MAQKWIGNGDGTAPSCDIERLGVSLPHEHDMTRGFVDGATMLGPWALMCMECHRIFGLGLGTGKGQKYDGTTHERIDG